PRNITAERKGHERALSMAREKAEDKTACPPEAHALLLTRSPSVNTCNGNCRLLSAALERSPLHLGQLSTTRMPPRRSRETRLPVRGRSCSTDKRHKGSRRGRATPGGPGRCGRLLRRRRR